MNPLTELVNTLTKKSTTSGIVIAVLGKSATVATFRGSQNFQITTNTPILIGDKVAIAHGQIVAKLALDEDVPQYIV